MAIQTDTAGIKKVSELNIDAHKDWNAKKIENLGVPDTDDDAARKDTPAAVAEHGADKHTDVTRELFIPASEGYIEAGTLTKVLNYDAVVEGAADLNEPIVHFTMKVPDDFVSFQNVKAVWYSPGAGNMFWRLYGMYRAGGEIYSTHYDDGGMTTTTSAGANLINVSEGALFELANLAKGDYLGMMFKRWGSDANDTLDAVCKLLGLLFTYTAEQ